MGEWYKGPPWPLFNSELWFIHWIVLGNQSTLSILIHCPHLAILVQEFGSGCLAQHAPPSGHGLFPKDHCLECQVAGYVYTSTMCECIVLVSLLNQHFTPPSSFFSIFRFHVAMISRPWVSCVSIVLLINVPVSLRHINSQTKISKSIILSSLNSTETEAPN
jgi:hypothetical protein